MSRVTVPKNFNHNAIPEFLNKCHLVFSKVGLAEKDFILDCSNIRKISVVGVLLIYKLTEFSVRNLCFEKPKIIRLSEGDIFDQSLQKYGFWSLMVKIINEIDGKSFKGNVDAYLQLKFNVDPDKFIIAPQPMLRDQFSTYGTLRTHFSEAISKFYVHYKAEMVLNCVSEVALNFWKHALLDRNSILVAEGNQSKIEIACADTGNGILSTLRDGNQNFLKLDNLTLIAKAMEKRVTSKPGTDHMGRGLWILDRYATLAGGILHVYSEGAHYCNNGGRTYVEKTGYWRGTIFYLNLPLTKYVSMMDILAEEISLLNKIPLGEI